MLSTRAPGGEESSSGRIFWSGFLCAAASAGQICAHSGAIWWMNLGLLVVSWDDSPQGYAVDRITGTNLGHGRGNTPQAAKENSEHFSSEESIFGATSTNHPGRAYPCQIPRFQPRAALPAEESRCFSLVPAAMCHGILRLTSNPSLAGALRRGSIAGCPVQPAASAGRRNGIARRTGTAPSGVRRPQGIGFDEVVLLVAFFLYIF
jgi:hypothetical protein